jgi:tetratricopeptide (TPR) repeat protein
MLRYISLTPINSAVLLLCTLLCLSLIPANTEAATNNTRYAIVLASAPGKNLKWEEQKSPLFKGRTIFTEQVTIKGSPWERQCLGYFENRQQAASLLKDIRQVYPGAWIQEASAKTATATVKPVARSSPATPAISKPAIGSNSSSLTEEQLDSLMQRAKKDITARNYPSAIRYLTALIDSGNIKYSREALELLGLARQRNNQTAHAVDIYEQYLDLYPEGEDSDRVRQRLAGLLTATSAPRKKIHTDTAAEDINDVTTYGSLSQTYLNNRAIIDGIGQLETQSQLITFVDVTTIQKTNKFDHRYQFTADDLYDFIDDDDNNQFRFIETYYEASYRKTGTSGRIGRQLLRIGGIRKRFDGLSAGYQINPDMRLNFLGGFPVDIENKTSVNRNKTFYGFTFETGTFLDHWDMNLFYFDQQVDGLTDRTNIGTDVHYRDKTILFFGMIDYDLFYEELNNLQFNANFTLDHGRTVYINAFMHKTPILSTSNALIGRTEPTIEELKKTLNIEQIYQLAKDRTANSQTATIGGTQQLTENIQTTADITFLRVGETVASGGVPATPEIGPDYYLNLQLISNNFFVKRDTNILGIRFYNSDASNTTSLIANSRFPITSQWRINPRLQFDIRKFSDGRTQQKLRALLKTDYYYTNRVRFDFEIGYEDNTEDASGPTLGNDNLFFILGYRWDFQ